MPENFDSIIFVGNLALIELRILLLKMCIHVFAGCFNDFLNELCPFLKIILCNECVPCHPLCSIVKYKRWSMWYVSFLTFSFIVQAS